MPLPEPAAMPPRGRGSASNPANRFTEMVLERDPEADGAPSPATRFYKDSSRSIIARNESPDVGFSASVNPYRGCEHGCAYCYARPSHEYLGLSAGLDFETRIFVKEDAPELLRRELSAPSWKPETIALSGVTDCYQPVERRLRLTRRCLEVLAEFRNPAGVVTKSELVSRDADALAELARHKAGATILTLTTLDADLARSLEPRASTPRRRLAAIEALAKAGVPVGVMVAPVIPGLTDHEAASIVKAAAQAGAGFAGMTLLRLPYGVKEIFDAWLKAQEPLKRDKVLSQVRASRGGRLNDPAFGSRMRGSGAFADAVRQVFRLACRRAGLATRAPELSTAAFRRASPRQPELF